MADPVKPETTEGGDGDQGTNPPTVTLAQSQATSDQPTQESTGPVPILKVGNYDANGNRLTNEELFGTSTAKAATSPGVGATEDSGFFESNVSGPGGSAGYTAGAGSEIITPQPNILDRFATYTYTASLYLLSPDQWDLYLKTGRRNVQGYNLLIQSGGAPNNIGGPQGALSAAGQAAAESAAAGLYDEASTPTTPGLGAPDAGRNPFFSNDFYIDSITLNNSLFGKSTGAAHSVVDMKFTVIEPANITLIDCLYNAVQDMQPKGADGSVNYAAAMYLMVIRFYGIDMNGQIQRVGAADPKTGLSDANAMVEKFIPFKIKDINFSVSGKLVSYEFQCSPTGQMIGGGTRRGTIPADIELSATTVEKMLTGSSQYGSGATTSAEKPGASTTDASGRRTAANDSRVVSSNPANTSPVAPDKANNAPNNKKTIKQGLMAAMNETQQQLVKDGVYNVADVYELVFANGASEIAAGKIAKPDAKANKAATPMNQSPSQNPSQSSPDKQNMDITARNWSVTAGQQIVQVIDQVIRNSSYITGQANIIIDEETGKVQPSPNANTKGMKWYNILMTAKQLEYDSKRNDFAYKITFTIVPYSLTEFDSAYFPQGKYVGVHKKYPWWFTGANTQIIDYQATFNKLYTLTVSGTGPTNSALQEQRKKQTSSMRDVAFIQYQARSTESSQGAQGKANELAASAAEYLYNPSDNANAKIRILGDPAWIQQGSLAGIVDPAAFSYNAFLPDGTINFDVNDILFEISWQKPADYDMKTGLADPYAKSSKTFGDRSPSQSVVYRAKAVTSEFKQGRFEQTIEGTLYQYPIPEGTNKASTQANPPGVAATNGDSAGSATETARTPLDQQNINTGDRTSGDATTSDEQPSSSSRYNDTTDAARLQQYGKNGARVDENATGINPGSGSGEFAPYQPTPSSDAAPADNTGGVESNGEDLSYDAFGAPTSSGRISAAQVAEINRSRASGFGIELDASPAAPQDIDRDW